MGPERVGDLLAEALTLHNPLSRPEVRERAEGLLDLVKLKPAKLAAFPPDLSGGEKRRVSIARVLAVEPRLIGADEPLSALDVSIAAQVANLLREHDLRMVELICHRVVVMYLGQVVEMAPARTLAAPEPRIPTRGCCGPPWIYTACMESAEAPLRWSSRDGSAEDGCRLTAVPLSPWQARRLPRPGDGAGTDEVLRLLSSPAISRRGAMTGEASDAERQAKTCRSTCATRPWRRGNG